MRALHARGVNWIFTFWKTRGCRARTLHLWVSQNFLGLICRMAGQKLHGAVSFQTQNVLRSFTFVFALRGPFSQPGQSAEEHLLSGSVPLDEMPEKLQRVPADKHPPSQPPLPKKEQDRGCNETRRNPQHVQPETRRVSMPPKPVLDGFYHSFPLKRSTVSPIES